MMIIVLAARGLATKEIQARCSTTLMKLACSKAHVNQTVQQAGDIRYAHKPKAYKQTFLMQPMNKMQQNSNGEAEMVKETC